MKEDTGMRSVGQYIWLHIPSGRYVYGYFANAEEAREFALAAGYDLPSKIEMAQHLRKCDLLKIHMTELGPICQMFGWSGRGTREELVETIHKEIWRAVYDVSFGKDVNGRAY